HLADTSHGVRNKCLQLLGNLGSLEKTVTKDTDSLAVRDVQKIIGDYFSDQDPRVRTAAIKAMLQLHERGLKLHQTIYNQVIEPVALGFCFVICGFFYFSIVPIPSSNEEIRLVDDAFGKICHMVSDCSWVVRVQAAKLLRKRTAHERAKELYSSGEFSSGRKWGDDAPKEEVDTGAVNLIESGACGAFVHGLEDELYVSSAVSPNITPQEDPSHQFLQQSLERVYSLQHLDPQGTQELLELTISTPPSDIAVLVLIFNAAKTCPTMPALFSDHTFRHYAYLRDSLSHLVPALRLPGRKLVSSAVSPNITPQEDPSHQFLQQSLERVYSLQHLDPQGAQELLELTIRDLQRLGELQSELAGVADFSATYLRCQLLLIKALQEKLWNVAAPLYLKQSDLASAAAKQIMEETYKMEFMYSGVENKQVVIIHHMRLQAKALQLIVTARTTRGVDPLFGMCEKFLQEVDFFQRCFITDLPHLQDSFVDKLLDLMPRLMTSKPAEVVKILHTMLRQSTFLHLPLPEQIHKASATIIEPAGESDNPLRFTSGLVVALDVDATLDHVQDPQSTVKVQVLYPDGQAQMIHPKPADFRNPGPGRHRLITQVYLSHTAWTEPCQVEVRLLLAYNSNSRIPKSPWIESGEISSQVETGIEGTIPFSKSVKVYIMPKPARR
ncbi:PREDICTED: integrator complex subunit 4-like, partial [Hipposideros armiger]|uniref:Integrator complex subunit 4-like n=1 Tax=Hipposideros armiger TaxID=186990 RepID=A0A8B7QGJ2_HIPAR